MGQAARNRLTPAEGRRFGLEVAAGLAVIGALAWWRSREHVAQVLLALAALAAGAGVLFPQRLGRLRAAWMALGHLLGRVMSPLFFGAVYYLVVTPTGIARRTFGRSPLARDPSANTYWIARTARTPEATRSSMERYF